MEDGTCICCGKTFDDKAHKLLLTHPNLFNGVDYICKSCAVKQERNSKELIKQTAGKSVQ